MLSVSKVSLFHKHLLTILTPFIIHSHHSLLKILESGSSHSAPKPTPRLSKPNITDTELPSSTIISHQSSADSEKATSDRCSGDFSDTKKFWESLDSQRGDELHSTSGTTTHPVPKPRSQVSSLGSSLLRNEESLENSSIRELSHSSSRISSEQQVEYSLSSSNADGKIELGRDDDSIVAEDRLEDESFPISEKFDLEGDARVRVDKEYRLDSLEYDNERQSDAQEYERVRKDSQAAYRIKEREDILDDGDDDYDAAVDEQAGQTSPATSFYIGDRSHNVITKSSLGKQSDGADDNTDNTQDVSQRDDSISGSYDLQQDAAENVIHKRPVELDLVKEEDKSESSRTSARIQKLDDEERTEYSHRSDFSADYDISKPQTTKVVHSPVDASKTYVDNEERSQVDSIQSDKVVIHASETNIIHSSAQRLDSFHSDQISDEFDMPKPQTAKVVHSPVESYKQHEYESSYSEQISCEFEAPKAVQARVAHSPIESKAHDSSRSERSDSNTFSHSSNVTHSPVKSFECERIETLPVEETESAFDIPQPQKAKVLHSPIETKRSTEETVSAVVHSPIQATETSEPIETVEENRSSNESYGYVAEASGTIIIEDMWPTSTRAKVIHSPQDAQKSVTTFEQSASIEEQIDEHPERASIVHSPVKNVAVTSDVDQLYSTRSERITKSEEDTSSFVIGAETKRPLVVHSPVEPHPIQTTKNIDANEFSEASQLVSTLTDRSACESLDDIPSLPKRDISSNEDSLDTLDVVHRSHKVQIVPGTRWSVTDPENCSSSGSHNDSFDKSGSRPLSSDVENLYSAYGGVSSEYQTARDASFVPGSTEYVTAASTLGHSGETISSQDSMKSLDSDSSGQIASLEVSEASETLVPSTAEYELPTDTQSHHGLDIELDENEQRLASLEACSGVLLEDSTDSVAANMKRSHEMIFQPSIDKLETVESFEAAKPIEIAQAKTSEFDVLGRSYEESKLVGSLEDGSQFSVSVSSTGNTIIENVLDDLASSLGNGSVIGSYELPSNLRDSVTRTSFDDGQSGPIDSMLMTSSFVHDDDVSSVNTQITTTSDAFSEISSMAGIENARRNRGHRRNDSTAFVKTLDLKASSDGDDISLEDEMVVHELTSEEDRRESGSDSDYDRYETEYSRSFRKPAERKRKKTKLEKVEPPREIERKKSVPSIETIVEDVNAEIESEIHEERPPSQNMQDYSVIPDITITDDPTKYVEDDDNISSQEVEPVAIEPTHPTQEEVQPIVSTKPEPEPVVEPQPIASRIPIRPTIPKKSEPSSSYGSSTSINYSTEKVRKMSNEKYEQLIDQQYQTKLAEQNKKTITYRDEILGGSDSPTSDSFEMVDVEQQDISDEFVIIEEVAKEADECMTEGKSVGIQKVKYEKKHDDEVEKIVVRSAPADSHEGSRILEGRHDMGFDFEESPPNGDDPDANGLDSSRRWVEMELAEQAQNLRYPYDMDRGILEDIKEEDTDLEVGSSRISSFKESVTGTPDYEAILARRYVTSKEETGSVSSLQEFESLEQAISLENRRYHQGSAESSNGSFPRRFNMTRSAQADEISLASLNEFEGLENACIEAHLLEIKAKEEHALLLSRSDESNKSNGSPNGKTITKITEITDKDGNTMRQLTETTTTVVTKAQPIVTRTIITRIKNEDIDDDLSSTNVMEVSTDSLELGPKHLKLVAQSKDGSSHHDSSDSLEISKSADIMTSSIDSIEISKDKSSKSDADSIEQVLAGRELERRDSIDSIDMQYALMSQVTKADRGSTDSGHIQQYPGHSNLSVLANQSVDPRLITSTTSVASSSGYGGECHLGARDISNDSLNLNVSEKELMLTSSESLTSSTNATYQNETDSQMSSSVTSCESTTLIDILRTRGARQHDSDDEHEATQTSRISTAYRTVTKSTEPHDFP